MTAKGDKTITGTRWRSRTGIRQALALGEQEGRESEAVDMLQTIYADRNDRKAFEALTRILQKQGRWADLEALYLERVQAGDRQYLERLGHAICAQDDREDEGRRWLLAAVEEGRDETLALMNLGGSSKRLGRTDEAISYFERALRLGDERALTELASLFEGGPRDAEVRELLQRAIDHGDKKAPAYLARRLWSQGSLDDLEKLYRLALERRHGPGPAAELGCVLRMHQPNRREEAGELVDSALEQGITWRLLRSVARFAPVTPEISIWLFGRALQKARSLGQEHPCGSDEFRDLVLADLIDALTDEQRFAEAEGLISSVSVGTAEAAVVKAAARMMEAQDRWLDVERIYRERIDAGDRSFLERLGHSIAQQEGRDADAEEAFRAAVSEDQDAAVALLNLGWLAERNRRTGEAIDFLERALRLGDLRAINKLAGLLEDGPRDEEVGALYRRAIITGDGSAPAYLARWLWQRGETDELEELFRLALERGHGPAPAAELACLLHREHPDRLAEAEDLIAQAMDLGIDSDLLRSVSRVAVIGDDAAIWMLSRALERATELGESHQSGTLQYRRDLLDALVRRLAKVACHAEAEALCRERIDAGEPEHLRSLAWLLRDIGSREDEAREVLLAAVADGVDPIDSLLDLASIEKSGGRVEAAVERLEQAIALGNEAVATIWLARLLTDGPRDDEVEPLLKRSEAAGFAPAFLDHAIRRRRLMGDNANATAADLVRAAIDTGITRKDLRRNLDANSVDHSERVWMFEVVLQQLDDEKRVALAAERADLQFDLASELESDPHTVAQARDLFIAAVEAGHQWGSLSLGLLEERQEQWQQAEYWFNVGAEKSEPYSLRGLGRVQLVRGDQEGAEEAYRRATDLGDGLALLDLEKLLQQRGDIAAVAALLCEGVERDIRDAHGALGRMLVELGAPYEDAFEHFRRAVALGDGRAATNLGYLLAERGQIEEAMAVYRCGVEAGDKYSMNNLAGRLAEQGQNDDAEELYRRSIALGCTEAQEGLDELLGH